MSTAVKRLSSPPSIKREVDRAKPGTVRGALLAGSTLSPSASRSVAPSSSLSAAPSNGRVGILVDVFLP